MPEDRQARIEAARIKRAQRLSEGNGQQAVKGYLSAAKQMVIQTGQAWLDRFRTHLHDSNALNGQVTIDTPQGVALKLTHGLIQEFLSFFAVNCIPRKHEKPSIISARNIWNGLIFYYESVLHTRVDDDSKRSAVEAHKRLLKDGQLVDYPVEATIISTEAFEAVAKSAFDLRWKGKYTFQRWQFLFLQAVELSTATRLSSHLPSDKESVETARTVQYCDFVINVSRNQNGPLNHIALTYKAARHKTRTTQRGEHTLLPQEKLWRCPVIWFLLLASLDGALPYTVKELYDPAILGREATRNFKILPSHASHPVCRSSQSKPDSPNYWTVRSFWETLGNACRIARIPTRIRTHDYRRTGAVMLLAAGESEKAWQVKLTS